MVVDREGGWRDPVALPGCRFRLFAASKNNRSRWRLRRTFVGSRHLGARRRRPRRVVQPAASEARDDEFGRSVQRSEPVFIDWVRSPVTEGYVWIGMQRFAVHRPALLCQEDR